MRSPLPGIVPILLSGGNGNRLWPVSRRSHPKQFQALVGEQTLIQQAAMRVREPGLFGDPLVIANADHRFLVAEQLRAIGVSATILLEPIGRNTAAAAAIAALHAARADAQALILLMPSDHVLRDEERFHDAVRQAAPAAERGRIALFAIRPTEAATGYGYLKLGEEASDLPGVHPVECFAEKPSGAAAEQYLADAAYHWNSGMFLARADVLIEELERHAGDVLAEMRAALDEAVPDLDFVRLAREPMERSPSISLDYAVMERTSRAVAVPIEAGWSDVGSWSSLWEIGSKDDAGNVLQGAAIAEQATGCYLRSDGPLVAALGVDDLIVSATPDAVLVTRKGADQAVKDLVQRLAAEGFGASTESLESHRPWGSFRVLHGGERFQVKQITVKPGRRLSLQSHYHRAEHWVVVRGTALVTLGGEERLVYENESIFVPIGTVHRLENPGHIDLCLIEIQSGAYLGEDDIVRLDDAYSRHLPERHDAPTAEPRRRAAGRKAIPGSPATRIGARTVG